MNVWDKNVPVEKSAYLNTDEAIIINDGLISAESNKPTMLDLFCGAGGFSIGCSWAGFYPAIGIDHLEPAMDTWTYNHPNSLGCLGDIKRVTPGLISELLNRNGISRINLITGGVPCQGFSRANRKHNDEDERNFLFIEYMKYVEYFMPDYIILENVSGLRSTANGQFESNILSYMDSLGYSADVKLLNAAHYGVPQQRHRLIFVGVLRNNRKLKEYIFPEGSFSNKMRTVFDAISDLPELAPGETIEEYDRQPLTDYQKLMRGNKKSVPIPRPEKLFNHTAPNHPKETVKRIADTEQGFPMYDKFKQRIRLKYDQPSPTQLAGGIRPQFQFGHPTQPRGLSIRERARLQSFPDSFVFKGGTVQERVQTGNAVPPLLIFELVKPMYNCLMGFDDV